MGNISRTFLLGAGFSKAVADGPLMKELWCCIERAYKREKSRKDLNPEDKELRANWFNNLNNFIIRLEKEATSRFEKYDSDKISTEIKENLEYLITLIDLHLNGPNIRFEKKHCLVLVFGLLWMGMWVFQNLNGMRTRNA